MIWITHLVFAVVLFLFVKSPLHLSWFALPVCLIAALIPDIDHRNSKISNNVPILPRIINLIFNHRGIVHSLAAAVAFSLLLFFALEATGINVNYAYAFALGYISHLFIDSLNPFGIAWLNPFSKRKTSGIIKTGGVGEYLLLIGLSGLLFMKFFNVI